MVVKADINVIRSKNKLCGASAKKCTERHTTATNEVVKALGKVRNQKKLSDNEFQVGIEFDFLSENDLDKLATVYPDINK